ncbi:hypothetical protein BJ165DRAFT_780218 [Panaeolus papilionaceus]|nr:hypothetical protein BJ165DRAFT_780218 [Panaeolus papilionaceus]
MSLSPAPSSASDSDELNNLSPRVYFGPLKTPERHFLASNRGLFPPVQPQSSPLRRSPRLSSPRPPSPSPREAEQMDNDVQEMALVAQLVNERLDEDDDNPDLNQEVMAIEAGAPDEPSSALAERISHAASNPSPPPSPTPLPMSFFDPYPSSNVQPGTDYQTDLFSLNFSGSTQDESHNSSEIVTTTLTDQAQGGVSGRQHSDQPEDPQILISVDTTSRPQTSNSVDEIMVPTIQLHSPMSVDDLLFKSPAAVRFSDSRVDNELHAAQVADLDETRIGEVSLSDGKQANMDVEGSDNGPGLTTATEPLELDGQPLATPPLRRSSRPRRSVTPVPTPAQVFSLVGPVFTAPVSSPARTQVKRKSKLPQPIEEIVSDSQSDAEDLLHTPPERTNARSRSRSPGKSLPSFQRELGSLSPTSTSVLATLNFLEEEPIQPPSSVEPEPIAEVTAAAPSTSIFPSQTSQVAGESFPPTTPSRTGPIRFASPSRSAALSSPTKFRLQPLATDDPRNTPARRIVLQPPPTSVSSISGAALPPPTPARRVLVQPDGQATPRLNVLKLNSPVKPTFTRRDPSAEPPQRMAANLKGKERAIDAPSVAPPSSSTIKAGQLPFPLVPPATAVSNEGHPLSGPPTLPKPKPSIIVAKSNLKQPSSSSRIPRIGAKPYARVIMKKDGMHNDKGDPPQLSGMPSGGEASITVKRPIRLVTEVSRPTASSLSRTKSAIPESSAAALKRKREEKASPAKPRVVIRQVPPVSNPQGEPSTSLSTRVQQLVASKNSTAATKKVEPPRYRLVPSVVLPKPAIQVQYNQNKMAEDRPDPESSPSKLTSPPDSIPTPPPVVPESLPPLPPSPPHVLRPTTPPPTLTVQEDSISPGSPMNQDPPELHSSPEHPPIATLVVEPVLPEIPPPSETEPLSTRRTTRARRAIINADGSVPLDPSSSRTTSRRKAGASRSANDDVFAGMSMTALKDLTLQNTEKNQRYLTAKLETEVVKKEGIRPESPMVKIKTISQRLQDAKEMQREERAQRRARRSDEMMSSDVEMSDFGYSSPAEDEASVLEKHTRGAGEDEDYVSPVKEFGDTRKNLFGATDEQMVVDTKRRVKWDRGLFTTVYLDEVKLGSRETMKENRDLKGILAAAAKALPLDTLGNLPHADTPLADLVPENVVVKKFVYESDPPPAPPVVPKNTRSRKKK